MTRYSISVHGTGFIGLVSGCCFAIRGFKSINSTFNEVNCDKINRGISPFFENGLDKLLKEAVDSGNFKCVIGREEAILCVLDTQTIIFYVRIRISHKAFYPPNPA